ncbi:MAG: alpha/beta fold hydrolase [Ilumatobacteraceae bacterium]
MARVLCLHGLGGTGATMWPIVGHLTSAQHTALAPTLPGHGSTPEDLVGVEWSSWLDAAGDWPADVVVGQSMGAMLALALAAEGRCRGVVAINPLAADPDAVDGLEWRISRGTEWHEVGRDTVGEVAYERLPMTSLLAMHTGILGVDLAAVTVPVLVVTSALDEVVDPASSAVVAKAVTGPMQRLVLDRSGHVASLDAQRNELAQAIVRFVHDFA